MFSKTGFWTVACLALTMCFFTTTARATTIVYYNSQVVSAINGISIDGTTYNVTFGQDTLDSTFFGNSTGATDAANAIDAALNTSTAAFVWLGNASVSINNFTVLTDNSYDGPSGTSFSEVGTWRISGSYLGSTAQFTKVPEPATLLLLALGLLPLAFFAADRKRRRALAGADG